jgi:hypothetical protein
MTPATAAAWLTVGSLAAPVLIASTSSSERSPSVMRATSAFVYGSPVVGFLIVSKWCSTLPARSPLCAWSPSVRFTVISSNHASGENPIALAMALIFS